MDPTKEPVVEGTEDTTVLPVAPVVEPVAALTPDVQVALVSSKPITPHVYPSTTVRDRVSAVLVKKLGNSTETAHIVDAVLRAIAG